MLAKNTFTGYKTNCRNHPSIHNRKKKEKEERERVTVSERSRIRKRVLHVLIPTV